MKSARILLPTNGLAINILSTSHEALVINKKEMTMNKFILAAAIIALIPAGNSFASGKPSTERKPAISKPLNSIHANWKPVGHNFGDWSKSGKKHGQKPKKGDVANCSCQYPLDATQEQYTPLTYPPFTSISGQTASYSIHDTASIEKHFIAASNKFVTAALDGQQGDIALPSSGIVAFEMRIDSFVPQTPESVGNQNLFVMLASAPITYRFRVIVAAFSGANNTAITIPYTEQYGAGSFGNGALTNLPLPPGYKVGIYINMNTRMIGYTLNGVDQGYHGALPPEVTHIGLILGADSRATNTEPMLGNSITSTLITDAAQMTEPFPTNSKDICGKVIGS
ncbi:MAG: DUF4882 family protein [Moraxellaceae bacterium]|nr:DUF4882 family protein [Moraxellaceae bacterium]